MELLISVWLVLDGHVAPTGDRPIRTVARRSVRCDAVSGRSDSGDRSLPGRLRDVVWPLNTLIGLSLVPDGRVATSATLPVADCRPVSYTHLTLPTIYSV